MRQKDLKCEREKGVFNMSRYGMPVGTCNFAHSTLGYIREFRQGKDALLRDHPDITLAQVRQYLMGEGELPEEVRQKVDAMQEVRKDAIAREMSYAKAQARYDGLAIPEKYLTGEMLDVYFSPETYRYYDFWVYSFFSWYEPWEEGMLMMGPLFSIDYGMDGHESLKGEAQG